ncbi:MAG: c-type cytochrome [Candidatus Acidiferrales bacterium]
MRKLGKISGYTFLVLLILLGAAITFTIGWRPFIGPRSRPLTNRTFAATPERLARGRYLVQNVMGCVDCHSPHDWTKHDAPILTGMEGAGEIFPFANLPGRIVAPNLTPDPQSGMASYTDDQLARAIREGISHDGRVLFPIMPYLHFQSMSDEDLASVIVYLRSLKPVHNALPATEIIFPVKYLIRSVPQPLTAPVPAPDLSTPAKRGAYLVNMASCSDCHTPQDNHGMPMPGLDFAGGFILEGPWGRVASANITPDASGISYYDETLFAQAMRTGFVKARQLNQIMPWTVYRGMTDDDLAAMFAYLQTLPPIHHRVDNTEPPTYCPLCKSTHGGGDQNHAPAH